MSGRLARVAVVGATGTVGGDLVEALARRRFPIQELQLVATGASLGAAIEWLGEDVPVEESLESLEGLDLLFLCTPSAAAPDWARRALEARVPCIDLSGALAGHEAVPLIAEDLVRADAGAPLASVPPPAALALALVLAPLAAAAGIARVSATLLLPASAAGRDGIAALESETVALFNQQEPEAGAAFPHPVAFDCHPAPASRVPAVPDALEAALGGALARLLGAPVPLALAAAQVPAFAGVAVAVGIETERPLALAAAAEALGKAAGLQLWTDPVGPGTRDALGRDAVLVGRLREDPSTRGPGLGLQLWLALDPIQLAVANAVRFAERRRDA